MKKSINCTLALIILLIITGIGGCKPKELTREEAFRLYQIRKIINERNYTFVATAIVPTELWLSMSSFGLTSRYTFEVSNDSLVTKLPYMGQSDISIPGKEGDGISFISQDFSQEIEFKNNNIVVTIIPNDLHNVKYATLTIMTNGVASLSIQELSRPLISYDGILEVKEHVPSSL